MKKIKIILVLSTFLTLTLLSFKPIEPSKANIEGIWVVSAYEDGQNIYKKAKAFQKDKPGIEFKADGTLIKKQNIGWCGTPPVSYGNYDGKWSWEDENTIRLEYEYWGGLDTMNLEITLINNHLLKAKWQRIN